MNDPDVPTAALALVERLANAIRATLVEEIDAYPGSNSPERADPINRAFAAVVRSILGEAATSPTVVSRTLRLAAAHRLASEGWSDAIIRALIEEEPGSPDDWLVFLLLSARVQIEPLVENDRDPH